MHIYFVAQIRKTCYRKKYKSEPWRPFIDRGTQPDLDSCWLSHWKWLVPDPMPGSWNFSQTQGVWIVFRGLTSCPNSVKKLWPAQSSKYKQEGSILTCPELVKLTQRVLLGTRLARYWRHYLIFTWLWQISLSLVTGATAIKFGH